MAKRMDRIGKRYGIFMVVGVGIPDDTKTLHWHVVCDCGVRKTAPGPKLGKTIFSCGCLNLKRLKRGLSFKHGSSGSRAYSCWMHMKQRCYNPNDKNYKNYGDRGIELCERWLEGFENFLDDMGDPPKGYSIDRIDNNRGYYKENCKWSTHIEQQNNTRKNRNITFNGLSMSVSSWARHLGLNKKTLQNRITRGWPIKRALECEPYPKMGPKH
jgi:hypothetical protein